jgi:hypothetical protein
MKYQQQKYKIILKHKKIYVHFWKHNRPYGIGGQRTYMKVESEQTDMMKMEAWLSWKWFGQLQKSAERPLYSYIVSSQFIRTSNQMSEHVTD